MRIRDFRESKGMTQDQLAGILGTSRSTIAMWEMGSNEPRAKMLVKLTEVFGCTADELLGIERKTSERDVPACVRDTVTGETREDPEDDAQPETRSEQIAANMSAAFAETIRRRKEEAAQRTAG